MMKFKSMAIAAGVLALALGPVPAALTTVDIAQANNGKGGGSSNSSNAGGNSNSNGNGNSGADVSNGSAANGKARGTDVVIDDGGSVGHSGLLASELKGLNAVKANPNALAHANPNSQVGRIAAYKTAALANIGTSEAITKAQEELSLLPVPSRSLAEIHAEIEALDPAAANYEDILAALKAERGAALTYFAAQDTLAAAIAKAETAQANEAAALLIASGGRELSDEAVAYIRSVLGL